MAVFGVDCVGRKATIFIKIFALLLVILAEVQMEPTGRGVPTANETNSHPVKSNMNGTIQLQFNKRESWNRVIQHVSDGEVSPRPSISYPFGTSTTDQTISPISSQLQTSDKPSANANYKSAVKTNSSESDFLTGVMRDAPAGDASSANKDEAPSEKPSTSENPLASKQPTDALQLTQQVLLRKGYPYIDIATSPNVTALLGKTAYLTCRVKNIGDKTVSWVRHRDIHLLTVGRYTYTTDQRFRAILHPNTEEYTLMIKYPQHRDSGIYECQVSTTPHLSHFVHLSVVEPVTEVVGGPEVFIDRGSTINLTCTVKFSPEPPSYIIWNHNDAIISYNSPRGGVSVLTEKGDTTTSYLLVQHAKPTDSGRYSCNPSNAVPHSILVHVLNGELPAAMQTGGQMPQQIPLSFCLLYSAILMFVAS